MSLIAWYPLNGNILDYSGNGNDLSFYISDGKIIQNTNGKIGSCYERVIVNDSYNCLRSKNKVLLNNDFTMCCWAYVSDCHDGTANGLVTNHSHVANAGAGITVRAESESYFKISCNTGNGTSRTYLHYYGTSNIKDKWSHLIIRFTKAINLLELIVNGIVEYSLTYPMYCAEDYIDIFNWSTTNVGSSSYRPASKINDVRIYNHALSEKEIKELARAKILHYTFDSAVQPYNNLIRNNTYSIYNNAGSTNCPSTLVETGEYYQGCKIYRLTQTPNDYAVTAYGFKNSLGSHGIYFDTRTYTALTKYCASILWKPISHSDTIFGGSAQNSPPYWKVGQNKAIGNGWRKYYQYLDGTTNTLDKTNPVFFFYCTPSLVSGQSIIIDFCCPSVIEDKIVPIDVDYDKDNVDIVSDSSGYKNDAILNITTTPDWSSDSRIGSGCYKFNYLTEQIKTPAVANLSDAITFSAWFFSYNINQPQNIYSANPSYFIRIVNAKMRWSIYANSSWTVGTGSATLSSNKWYHVVMVYDRVTLKGYVNGILDYNLNLTGRLANSFAGVIRIGYTEAVGENTPFYGLIDDTRIYATALSEEDIINIYKERASIDNTGNFYINTLIEKENLFDPLNRALKEKVFKYGLSAYTQSNCRVTLTDKGFRIFRPPNLVLSEVGNTMYGGLKIANNISNGFSLQQYHKYRIKIDVDGKSSNRFIAPYWTNNMGWGGGGLSPSPQVIKNIYPPSNFEGESQITYEFYIPDTIKKVCTTSYNSFIEGETYFSYSHFAVGFTYQDTGALGTDLYLTNFKMFDLTENIEMPISLETTGTFYCDNVSEVGISNGLITWYPLNGNANDYCDRKDGAVNGATISSGFNQSAYSFDGVDDYIICNDIDIFSLDQDFTVSFWCIFDTSKTHTICCARSAVGEGFSIFFISGVIKFDSGGQWTTSYAYPLNTWIYVTVSKTSIIKKLYINGSLHSSTSAVGSMTSLSSIMTIGASHASGGSINNFMDGKIQDLRIYNRALSQREIMINYELTKENRIPIKIAEDSLYISGQIKEVM